MMGMHRSNGRRPVINTVIHHLGMRTRNQSTRAVSACLQSLSPVLTLGTFRTTRVDPAPVPHRLSYRTLAVYCVPEMGPNFRRFRRISAIRQLPF